jgi:IS30 family transposase
VLPRNTQKARSAHLRLKVVEMSSAGQSGIEIAEQLGISAKTVQRHLKKYIETDSRYPTGLDAGQVESMRVEELNTLEHYQRQIALRLSKMSEPTTFVQEAKAVEVAAMAGSAYVKLSEQKARLFGLNAAKPEGSGTVTNNLMITGTSEVDYLKNLARLKELEIGHQ